MILGVAALAGGVLLFKAKTSWATPKLCLVIAGAGVGLFILGFSVVGTFVEVSDEMLKGHTGKVWDRYSYTIYYDELESIEIEERERTDLKGRDIKPGTYFLLTYKDGDAKEIRRDGYLKAAQSKFLEHAEATGVSVP